MSFTEDPISLDDASETELGALSSSVPSSKKSSAVPRKPVKRRRREAFDGETNVRGPNWTEEDFLLVVKAFAWVQVNERSTTYSIM